jgi:transposase-like protein
MTQRKHYDGTFRARVVIEAIKGQKTVNEIVGTYEVHPTQVVKWKKEALAGLPDLLSDQRSRKETTNAEAAEKLYQQIGQLTMEVAYLKKKLQMFP